MDRRSLTAPCGLDCFNCDIFVDNITEEMTELVHTNFNVPKDDIPCKGCRQQDGRHFHLPPGGCATLNCAKKKDVEFCYECDEFPCKLLAPLADEAQRYPHNFKLFNLCRIQKIGFDQWAEEEAKEIRKSYFTMKFVVGKGQKE